MGKSCCHCKSCSCRLATSSFAVTSHASRHITRKSCSHITRKSCFHWQLQVPNHASPGTLLKCWDNVETLRHCWNFETVLKRRGIWALLKRRDIVVTRSSQPSTRDPEYEVFKALSNGHNLQRKRRPKHTLSHQVTLRLYIQKPTQLNTNKQSVSRYSRLHSARGPPQ